MPVIESAGLAEAAGTRYGAQVYRGDYSFAVDGGAVGVIALSGATGIPSGAIVTRSWIEVTTAPTSAGAATISVGVEGAADIQAAAAISGAPWSTTGVKTGSATFKTTAARDVSITIGIAALTAGVFRVYVEYITAP